MLCQISLDIKDRFPYLLRTQNGSFSRAHQVAFARELAGVRKRFAEHRYRFRTAGFIELGVGCSATSSSAGGGM